MKKICLVLMAILLVQSVASAEKFFYKRFNNKDGRLVDSSQFVITQLDDGMTRYVWDNKNDDYWEITEYTYDQEGMCVIYHRTCDVENTKYTVVNDGKQLTINGTLDAVAVNKVVPYRDHPFYANPKIDLMYLLRTKEELVQFWTLRKDNLQIYKMRADYQGIDTIVVNGHMMHGYLISWGPSMSLFTKYFGRKYWFREDDYIFVKQTGSNRYGRELIKQLD